MPSDKADPKRTASGDEEVPAEGAPREAQDRAQARGGAGGARSPVDSMHVDAPKQQDNKRGHAQQRHLEEG
jgi:hypothetical protein